MISIHTWGEIARSPPNPPRRVGGVLGGSVGARLRPAPMVLWEPPPLNVGGVLWGVVDPTVPLKAPHIYGGVETLLIYRVSFNSLYILITPFLHDINPV